MSIDDPVKWMKEGAMDRKEDEKGVVKVKLVSVVIDFWDMVRLIIQSILATVLATVIIGVPVFIVYMIGVSIWG